VIHTISLSAFIQRMLTLGGDVEATVVNGLQEAGFKLHELIVDEIDHASPHPAVDRSELRNSVEVVMTAAGCRVVVKAPHAAIMEDGTRPFRPPYQPILEWLLRKQLVPEEEAPTRAWMIVQAIAKRGIAPRHYMAKAFARFTAGRYVGRSVGKRLEALAEARGRGRDGQARRGSGLKGGKGES
jgi:hypothetical protein